MILVSIPEAPWISTFTEMVPDVIAVVMVIGMLAEQSLPSINPDRGCSTFLHETVMGDTVVVPGAGAGLGVGVGLGLGVGVGDGAGGVVGGVTPRAAVHVPRRIGALGL